MSGQKGVTTPSLDITTQPPPHANIDSPLSSDPTSLTSSITKKHDLFDTIAGMSSISSTSVAELHHDVVTHSNADVILSTDEESPSNDDNDLLNERLARFGNSMVPATSLLPGPILHTPQLQRPSLDSQNTAMQRCEEVASGMDVTSAKDAPKDASPSQNQVDQETPLMNVASMGICTQTTLVLYDIDTTTTPQHQQQQPTFKHNVAHPPVSEIVMPSVRQHSAINATTTTSP